MIQNKIVILCLSFRASQVYNI